MSDKLKELREQRGKLVADARAILNKAEAEKRSATAEESAQFDAMMGKAGILLRRWNQPCCGWL